MKTRLRLFGAGVIIFNLWLSGRYSIGGIPALLMTLGFAVAYEFIVVRAVNHLAGAAQEPEHHFTTQQDTLQPEPDPEPQGLPEDLAAELGITFDGHMYRYQDYSYERLSDAIAYAKIDRSRPIRCK